MVSMRSPSDVTQTSFVDATYATPSLLAVRDAHALFLRRRTLTVHSSGVRRLPTKAQPSPRLTALSPGRLAPNPPTGTIFFVARSSTWTAPVVLSGIHTRPLARSTAK